MELRNCSKCGRVFAYEGSEYCSRCNVNDEDDFKKVKEYLYDHPGASVAEVSEETGVTEKQILRYLRENRIEIVEEANYFLDCERCGKSIRSGRYCDECAAELKRELISVLKKDEKKEKKPANTTPLKNTRMYTAEIRKKMK